MSEARPEQIADAIVARLQGIVADGGVNYWYTPDQVVRTHGLDPALLNGAEGTVFYVLLPDGKEEARRTSGGGPGGIVRGSAYLTLALIQRMSTATEKPYAPDLPLRWTLQERMERDVRKRLRQDPYLGGSSSDVNLRASDESDQETHVDGWALAILRVTVTYHYREDTP